MPDGWRTLWFVLIRVPPEPCRSLSVRCHCHAVRHTEGPALSPPPALATSSHRPDSGAGRRPPSCGGSAAEVHLGAARHLEQCTHSPWCTGAGRKTKIRLQIARLAV